jgi:hypothetical protein
MEALHGATGVVTLFLLLRAFSSGRTALTGVEAISNGNPAFRDPKSKNAGFTLIWMSVILGTLLLGHIPVGPDRGRAVGGKTVISQLRARSAARNLFAWR